MSSVVWIKIGVLVFFCLYATIDDIFRGIVSNRVVAITIILGIILTIAECIISPDRIPRILITCLVFVLSSLCLFLTRIWAGGDSKMMFAIALLVPYEETRYSFAGVNPCIMILALSFALGYVYLIVESILRYRKGVNCFSCNGDKISQRIGESIVNWLICTIHINLINSILLLVFHISFGDNRLVIYAMNYLFALIIIGFKVFRNRVIILISVILNIMIPLVFSVDIRLKHRLITSLIVMTAICIRVFVDKFNYQEIEFADLKKGMILSMATTIQFSSSRIKNLPQISTENLKSRLTATEVEAVKKWCEKKQVNRLTVVRKIPFAVFLSLGSLIYVIGGVSL